MSKLSFACEDAERKKPKYSVMLIFVYKNEYLPQGDYWQEVLMFY